MQSADTFFCFGVIPSETFQKWTDGLGLKAVQVTFAGTGEETYN